MSQTHDSQKPNYYICKKNSLIFYNFQMFLPINYMHGLELIVPLLINNICQIIPKTFHRFDNVVINIVKWWNKLQPGNKSQRSCILFTQK